MNDHPGRRDAPSRPRRLAVALLSLTLLVLTIAPGVRARAQHLTSGTVAAASHWFTPRDAELERERRARLTAEAKAARVNDAEGVVKQAAQISESFGDGTYDIVTARVIATTPVSAAGGGRRVQLDAGSDHGVEADRAVVAPGGLIGRVTAVTRDSATVTLITDPASVVGARVESSRALARVVGDPPDGVTNRDPGNVSLVLAQQNTVTKGSRVVTAGSPGGRPYPAGLPIGTVTALDGERGRLERSATLAPSADLDSLDVVGVLTVRAAR